MKLDIVSDEKKKVNKKPIIIGGGVAVAIILALLFIPQSPVSFSNLLANKDKELIEVVESTEQKEATAMLAEGETATEEQKSTIRSAYSYTIDKIGKSGNADIDDVTNIGNMISIEETIPTSIGSGDSTTPINNPVNIENSDNTNDSTFTIGGEVGDAEEGNSDGIDDNVLKINAANMKAMKLKSYLDMWETSSNENDPVDYFHNIYLYSFGKISESEIIERFNTLEYNYSLGNYASALVELAYSYVNDKVTISTFNSDNDPNSLAIHYAAYLEKGYFGSEKFNYLLTLNGHDFGFGYTLVYTNAYTIDGVTSDYVVYFKNGKGGIYIGIFDKNNNLMDIAKFN